MNRHPIYIGAARTRRVRRFNWDVFWGRVVWCGIGIFGFVLYGLAVYGARWVYVNGWGW